jgi:hypothetical protein
MTPSDCEKKIKRVDEIGIKKLWRAVKNGKSERSGWQKGKAFEYLILRAFEIEGATVKYPYGVWFQGKQIEEIDGVIYLNNIDCLVEAKDKDERISIEPIAKLRNQLLRRPSPTIGAVFSKTEFTSSATLLAGYLSPQTVLLWTGKEIDEAIKSRKMCETMRQKYRWAIEYGLPDYDLSINKKLK